MESTDTLLSFCERLGVCLVIGVALIVATGAAGCLNTQPPTAVGSDSIRIDNRYYYNYNGTSFLTGILVNTAQQSLVNVNLQAEGYANDTVYERGLAGPDTGIKSVILPNENSTFMIKMSPVTAQNATTSSQAQKPQLNYRIVPQIGSMSAVQPYPLSTINTKAAAVNQAINVSGEVYNGGNQNVTSSIVAAAFYQENGTVLGVFTGSPQGDLGPKETAPFEIDVQTSAFPIKPARTEIYAYELVT